MRVSYNGYYAAFPRLKRGFNSRHPHHSSATIHTAMNIPSQYFRDRRILLLLTINVFVALLQILLISVRLISGHSNRYIVQYRSNLDFNAFRMGTVTDLIMFALFALFVAALHIVLSMRTYHIHRQFSIVVLSLGLFLLVLSGIVSNALLVLR